jgi:tetratricopeptide (TPR) repeat protein
MRTHLQGLFHRIVESSNPQEANEARLQMAKIYLSDGMAVEALGLLDGINRTNPSFYRSAKVSAMHGAGNFLLYRFVEAARDFSAPELNNNKEIEYWRGMLADLLGNPDQSYDYLAMNQDYISKYPPMFRQRLAIVAADRAIDAKEYNTALKIFDKLHQDNMLEPINAYINYLLAKVSADTGQPKEAQDMWNKLAGDFEHPFVQARAEFSRIAWDMDHDTITKDQAVDRLERLRLGWHGDGLELKVLTLLGDLYSDKKDYVNAMRIWNGGVISFPNTGAAIDMARKMQEAFITMFNEGIADKLPPLEALALYYEYRNYTPPGATGNEMIERLADRLVDVDLLDQASSLLDHQMHFQLEKEQRSRIGVKLANVYLLNHQPQKALTALQDSLYGENSLMLRLLRNRLTAQALVDMGQPDRAMATLGSDNSADAERIRMSVYWRQKEWTKLVASIEGLLKTRPDNTAPISLEESEYLLKLSLAYVFENNSEQLQYLHDYFGPLMEKNPNKPVFDFITGGQMQLTTTNFDEVLKYLSDTRSFIENYKAHIQTPSMQAAK